jgi:hypothetical protein
MDVEGCDRADGISNGLGIWSHEKPKSIFYTEEVDRWKNEFEIGKLIRKSRTV